MSPRRLLLVLSSFALASGFALLSPARAALASFGGAQHVQASLVAADASLQPGRPFTVALRLVHDAHWHTYWKNPGTGLATELKWTLPTGFTAGDIQWPAPVVIKDAAGNVTGNGYEGDLLLPVTITPPADLQPGARVDFKV
ncbi:MAG: protein-disulfide reductase DsbD domain-containing protein, partial [Acidobacteriota bacterium]